MNSIRAFAILVVLGGIALGLVQLRTAQSRAAASLLRMEAKRIALRRMLWDLETSEARLRAPERIIDATEMLPASLVPPGPLRPLRGPTTLIVQRPWPRGTRPMAKRPGRTQQ